MSTVVLIIIGLFSVATAATALSMRNLIHAALCLTLTWFGMAAFFLWAGVEFIAFAQVFVYVGAVSMVVLFAVLLTRNRREASLPVSPGTPARAMAGVATAGVVAAVLVAAIVSTPFDAGPADPPEISIRMIGELLMGREVASLLAVGVLLTVALIGAVVIAAADRGPKVVEGRHGEVERRGSGGTEVRL